MIGRSWTSNKIMVRSASKIFAFVFVLVLAGSVWAQKSVDTTPKSTLIDATALLDDIRILSNDDMEGRSAANPSMQKARDYVQRRFRESGISPLNPTYDQEFQIKTKGSTLKGVNFVGIIKGSKNPENYIIVTAHYDHLGIRNGAIYNGADDNASGTAALFALAKAFKKDRPLNSLIFVACDGEEEGDQGSKYFVANLPVKKESVLLNINMDMVSRNDKGELWAAGAFANPALRPTLEEAQTLAKVKLRLGHDDPKLGHDDWTGQSDQESFHNVKIPWVYFGVEDHKDYHKPTDDFVNIMPEFYVHAVETILITARLFDKELPIK